jgi:hypothetical protein
MNKDLSLKSNENNLVLLVVGNDDTGKKSIVSSWMNKNIPDSEEQKTFYKIFYFQYKDTIDEEELSLKVEVRIINGEEFESDLKDIAIFFKGALGAFVITSIDEYVSFQDGVKWKEKVDLMCCLPNKFPLPVNLIINKCDLKEKDEKRPWLDKEQIENYARENQFVNHFLISSKESKDSCNYSYRESLKSIESVDVDFPLKDIIKTIFQFKDLKEKFFNHNKSVNYGKNNNSKINSKDINNSLTSSKSQNETKKNKQDKNCSIL